MFQLKKLNDKIKKRFRCHSEQSEESYVFIEILHFIQDDTIPIFNLYFSFLFFYFIKDDFFILYYLY